MGGAGGKPRPAVVVQSDETLGNGGTVLVCPLTTDPEDAPLVRPVIEPNRGNGLRERSEAMIERVGPARPNQIGRTIGSVAPTDMAAIERALVNVLGLGLGAFGISA